MVLRMVCVLHPNKHPDYHEVLIITHRQYIIFNPLSKNFFTFHNTIQEKK